MRCALLASGETGLRAGRVLLAEPDISLGLLGSPRLPTTDHRVHKITDPTGWPLIVTDAPPDDPRLTGAIDHGIPIVTSHRPTDPTGTWITGASPQAGLAPALAVGALTSVDEIVAVEIGTTCPPRRVKRDHALPFPGPIGSRWAEEVPPRASVPKGARFYEAPHSGPLLGLTAHIDGMHQGQAITVVHGVVDNPQFLAGIALAAAAIVIARTETEPGISEAAALGSDYLRAAEAAGMEIAAFTSAA